MSLRLLPTEQHDRRRHGLTVALLSPEVAFDFEFVAARLHDQSLLDGSVAVRIFRAPLLAVPVGGCRRGGRLNAGPLTVALAVHGVLRDQDGFPQLRVTESAGGGDYFVEWGEQMPPYPDRSLESRRFFGYAPPETDASCLVPEQDNGAAATAASGNSDRRRRHDVVSGGAR